MEFTEGFEEDETGAASVRESRPATEVKSAAVKASTASPVDVIAGSESMLSARVSSTNGHAGQKRKISEASQDDDDDVVLVTGSSHPSSGKGKAKAANGSASSTSHVATVSAGAAHADTDRKLHSRPELGPRTSSDKVILTAPSKASSSGHHTSMPHTAPVSYAYAAHATHAPSQNGYTYAYPSPAGRIPMVNGANAHLPSAMPPYAYGGSTMSAYNGYGPYSAPYAIPTPPVLPPTTMPYTPRTGYAKAAVSSPKPRSPTKGVIDLTSVDSASEGTHVSIEEEVVLSTEKAPPAVSMENEDDDLIITGEKPNEATNPVCIGQLTGMALVLYPVASLIVPGDALPTPLPCLLHRADPQSLTGRHEETIKLYCPHTYENFGVLEHRLANALGPLLTKDNRRGAGVWIEPSIIRTKEAVPMMLRISMLLFCHPHFVQLVGDSLEKSMCFLEHPTSYNPDLHEGFRYHNPHGIRPQQPDMDARRRAMYAAPYTPYGRQYGVKTVEVQREQVESMFKTLKSGVDLEEAEPDASVITKLYPHQKQALAFLLDRELDRKIDTSRRKMPSQSASDAAADDEEDMIALWRAKRDVYGRFIGWHNVVTEVEIGSQRPPPQCRGAILADDMGLGKTIVVISLIANTLHDGRHFAASEPCKERNTESFDALAVHPAGKAATQAGVSTADFKSTMVGGMQASGSASGKKKKENKNHKKREEYEASRLQKLEVRSRATLIVCPLSTVVNWESQLEEHIGVLRKAAASKKRKGEGSSATTPEPGLSVYVYHGANRCNRLEQLADYDVVITTYSTLASEYSKQCRKDEQDEAESDSSDGGIEEIDSTGQPVEAKSKKRKRKKIEGNANSPLQQIEWFRIVLDEAHMIKEHSTIQARAACDLAAQRRTCLTGTPLQNSLNDLFSLMRFLRIEPFSDRTIWTAYIGAPAKIGDPLGVSRLQLLMRHLALRRTKDTKDKNGQPILQIPPKKDFIRHVTLDEQEKAFYTSHHRRYKHNFEALAKTDSLLKNYCSILQEVLRLRQICVHMGLVQDSEDRADLSKDGDPDDIVSSIKAHGLSKDRALRLLGLMRDTGAAQCAECGAELASAGLNASQDDDEVEEKPKAKRSRKPKGSAKPSRQSSVNEADDNVNPSAPTPVVTRCQHLFCIQCFQKNVCLTFPDSVTAADRCTCSICREELSPIIDAVQMNATDIDVLDNDEETETKKTNKRRIIEHSSKIKSLMRDLVIFSENNPASANYMGDNVDLALIDEDEMYRPQPKDHTKTVVFSQWTKLLDRCEDALNASKIRFERLDGGMARPERSRALATFKADPSCEVLLVSLRAGGVGLNLTHASNVYLLEPSWNPSVENQAVDRIHRLGQTKPVRCIRLVVKDSIETNMLEIQKRKVELANLSLSQTLSKAQLAERRLEDLRTLFK